MISLIDQFREYYQYHFGKISPTNKGKTIDEIKIPEICGRFIIKKTSNEFGEYINLIDTDNNISVCDIGYSYSDIKCKLCNSRINHLNREPIRYFDYDSLEKMITIQNNLNEMWNTICLYKNEKPYGAD